MEVNTKDMLTALYATKEYSKNRIAVLVHDRNKTLKKLQKMLGGVTVESDYRSAFPHIEVEGLKVYVKPIDKQGDNSPGLKNEYSFYEALGRVFRDGVPQTGINVEIRSSQRNLKIPGVIGVRHAGANVKGRRKADIILETLSGDYPLSLKQDNAQMWESADKLCRDLMLTAIVQAQDEGGVDLKKDEKLDIYKMSNSVAVRCSDEMAKDVMFGSDIEGHGAILFKTFTDDDIKRVSFHRVVIKANSIVTSLNHVRDTDHEPWILFRNDSARKYTAIPGVRSVAITRSRLTSKVYIPVGTGE